MPCEVVDLAQCRRLKKIEHAIAAERLFSQLARLQHRAGEISGATLDAARCTTIARLTALGFVLQYEQILEDQTKMESSA
jgi:hypothetical protein